MMANRTPRTLAIPAGSASGCPLFSNSSLFSVNSIKRSACSLLWLFKNRFDCLHFGWGTDKLCYKMDQKSYIPCKRVIIFLILKQKVFEQLYLPVGRGVQHVPQVRVLLLRGWQRQDVAEIEMPQLRKGIIGWTWTSLIADQDIKAWKRNE